jgi:hypothetical protein
VALEHIYLRIQWVPRGYFPGYSGRGIDDLSVPSSAEVKTACKFQA